MRISDWSSDVCSSDLLEYDTMRAMVLATKVRVDGRDLTTVRPISISTSVLPRTHGPALFTRGETQAIVVTTLGTARDGQVIDAVSGEYKQHFMFHYNFPPFCPDETRPMMTPRPPELGNARLTRRGVLAGHLSVEELP